MYIYAVFFPENNVSLVAIQLKLFIKGTFEFEKILNIHLILMRILCVHRPYVWSSELLHMCAY